MLSTDQVALRTFNSFALLFYTPREIEEQRNGSWC